ncbi:uncharacterized protein LOC117782119 [Drosophila innubila]|uniref:uncharacterized protein LOC117782119 n=1 Tax=Drosophila innubila TaxID=198719 RepID=UPI00148BD542|nr:uncharacterized protein LOC117782119 [Drosophila innubila]
MSCWPMQNRGNTNGLADEFKWNQMNTSYNRCTPSRNNTWDKWYKHNLKVTQELSILMEKPISEVAELLYNLTLQNYNNILNPMKSGWNAKRVPLSRMDVCDRYLKVFDLAGNLRDRRHPRSLILLLEFMQSIIGPKTESDSSTSSRLSPTDSTFTIATARKLPVDGADTFANKKYKELYNMEDKVYFMYSKRLGRLIDPDIDKIAVAIEKRISVNNDPVKGPSGTTTSRHCQLGNMDDNRSINVKDVVQRQGDYGNVKDVVQRERNYGNDIQKIRNRSASLSVGGRSLANDRSDFMLNDDKGRRFGHGSVQLMDLRSKRNEILRILLAKVKKADTERFLKSLGSIDLRNPRVKLKKVKSPTEELAKFYSNVVTDVPRTKSTIEKFKKNQKYKPVRRPTIINESVDQLVLPKERRYYGEAMPVLYHAPYKDSDRSTWMRRYPDQLRMQEDGQLGQSSNFPFTV